MDEAPPAIVVGAAGGLGRAFCTALEADVRFGKVFALSRRVPVGWRDTPERQWLPVDILDEASLAAAAATVSANGRPTRIIVATGLLHADGVLPEKSLRTLSAATLSSVLSVNAIGPALVAKHLLPLTPRQGRSHFAVLSARVGSIADNRSGGWYAYRMSKAALNMLVRSLAIEHHRTHPDAVCVALHPGTVDTALSAPFQGQVRQDALFSPDRSAGALTAVLDGLGPENTGGFFAWDGQPVPW